MADANFSPTPAYLYRAIVLRWIDGDTVDLSVDLGFSIQSRQRFRVTGVDAPERGQAGYAEATAFMQRMAPPGRSLVVASTKADKYGRYLAVLHLGDGTTLNKRLLDSGLAKSYDGGAR